MPDGRVVPHFGPLTDVVFGDARRLDVLSAGIDGTQGRRQNCRRNGMDEKAPQGRMTELASLAVVAAEQGGGWARVFIAASGDRRALEVALATVVDAGYRRSTAVPQLLIEAAIVAALELVEHIENRGGVADAD